MAVGLGELPLLHPIAGIKISAAKAGIKYPDRYDLTLFELDNNATVAAVFTKNQFSAAPVQIAKKHFSSTSPRFLVVNTGNANCGTGETGLLHSRQSCEAVAKLGACSNESVLPFSTGVIGETLAIGKLIDALPTAFDNLSEDNWALAAESIMTTDTVPKGCSRSFKIYGEEIYLTGVTKGSGMVKPDMATMLSYIGSNIGISETLLQSMLQKSVDRSFNCITVDGDTSTNDACVLIATGKTQLFLDENSDAKLINQFQEILNDLCIELAQAMVRDAEGATKFITVHVKNGLDQSECSQVAYTVAHSPLVKTAFFASDPNWGRILAAIGRAGVENLDISRLSIYLNSVCIVEAGGRAASYTEERGQAEMDKADIAITIDLARGAVEHIVWTSDLSHDYIKINAEYRT